MAECTQAWQIGYCTNVHAGPSLDETLANLGRYALAVKASYSPAAPMGVGLWLSASAARTLLSRGRTAELADWLAGEGLLPFTLNGFPHGDFHQPVVKHLVYQPPWWEPARRDYTLDLIDILHAILPAGIPGSISTLPLGWGNPPPDGKKVERAAEHLWHIAARLARLEAETGRTIVLALEPEPGCALQFGRDVVRFFENYLLSGGGAGGSRPTAVDEAALRRHIGVCHDVCHAAVMFEEQEHVLQAYRAAGIRVGKVQVSSAVCVDLDALPPDDRRAALDQLSAFHEPRYLHQTCVRRGWSQAAELYEDLHLALTAAGTSRGENLHGQWRTHFHVPIYLNRLGLLNTSQPDVLSCLAAVRRHADTTHFEVETYAWNVLPAALRPTDLAAGIAQELAWFREAVHA